MGFNVGLSGGGNRTLTRPNRPDGNIQHDLAGHRVIGNHKGNYAALNIVDPRPGTVHQFGLRKSANVIAARQRGWWIADPERDGRPAYDLVPGGSPTHTPLDSASNAMYPDLVHLVTSVENYRRLMDEQEAANREALSDGGEGFLAGADQSEAATGRTQHGFQATRFALRQHSTLAMDGDQVLEQLTPNGVLREE